MKIKKTAAIVSGAVLVAAGMGIMSAGSASAETVRCSDTRHANTNGNLLNDHLQQANKIVGTVEDTAACSVVQANSGLNGGDNPRADIQPLLSARTS
ncbi:hypothetical protein ACFZAV_43125 [Streptomyces sp. NPDC008343]|uniref:hypothetical protein n=1 Tax=Streptomyces sp. NPDC008343 TaxID=3364828 RepID=UPI0036E1A664